jgi:hypothetical protein
VTISMHQSSVGVFTHFLGSLSDLLDLAAAHAEVRKINPAILLNARLYPNMYNLTRQVGETNRHAVLACALLAGIDPPVFPETEPDIPELKARVAIARDFVGSIQPAQINGAGEKEVVFTFRNGSTRWSWPRRIFWERQIREQTRVCEAQEGRPALYVATVAADHIRRGGAAGHLIP